MPGRIVLSLIIAVSALATAGSALARPGHGGGALRLAGYRVMVEPEIVEDNRDELVTARLHWKLRAVYVDRSGDEVYVIPRPERGMKRFKTDSSVNVGRAFAPGMDHARVSRRFGDLRRARDRFEQLHRSGDITRLRRDADEVDDEPMWTPPRPVEPPRHPVRPAPPLPPSCRDALIARGHHPNQLSYCDGAEPYCAVALLDKGHHPNQLSYCEDRLAPGCTQTLLARGHHPNQLSYCRQVEDACAVALLDKGHHPNQLSNCRR